MWGLWLNKILRYLSPSLSLLGLWAIYDYSTVMYFINTLSFAYAVALVIILIFIGSIFYIVYREFIHDPVIIPVQNWLRRKSANQYNIIRQYCNCNNEEARLAWFQIKKHYLTSGFYDESMEDNASAIHATYMIAILSLVFLVIDILKAHGVWWAFLIIFVVSLATATLADKSYENLEAGYLISLPEANIQEVMGFARHYVVRMRQERERCRLAGTKRGDKTCPAPPMPPSPPAAGTTGPVPPVTGAKA